jgi:glutamine synthetase
MSSNMSADVTKLLKKIEADKVKFIRLQFTDIQGQPKNVSIPVIQAEKALTEGIWFDGSSIEGFARIEESDMMLKPDPSTYAVLPWRPQEGKVARFICDVQTYGNKSFDGDPRYILRKTIAEAAKMGFTFNTGPELEFFLFKMYEGVPTTEFEDRGGYFDLAPTDSAEDVRRDVVLALSDMGFPRHCRSGNHLQICNQVNRASVRFARELYGKTDRGHQWQRYAHPWITGQKRKECLL